jgi:hypothetical protein
VTLSAFLLYALAVARLTHLVNQDSILDRPRGWMEDQSDESPKWRWMHTLVTCPWCFGAWCAAGLYAIVAVFVPEWREFPDWLLAIPAASYVTGWMEMALGAMDDE